MSRSFVAAALLAVLTGPALAQETPAQAPAATTPAAAPAATPAESAPETRTLALPQVLRDAGLTDFDIRPTRHGSRVKGSLPDGTELSGMMDEKGALRGVRIEGDAVLPPALLERLVPAPVRGQPLFAQLGKVQAVFLGPKEDVMLAGVDDRDQAVRAAFAPDGTLMRFERGGPRDAVIGPMGGPGDKGPRHDPKDHGPKDHGPKDHRGDGPDGKDHDGKRGHDKDRDGKDRHDRDRDGKDRGDRDRGDRGDRSDRGERGRDDRPRVPPTPDEVRASLTEAGYRDVGQILQQGPVTVAQATNPEGEPVLVEIGTDGEVRRELNR